MFTTNRTAIGVAVVASLAVTSCGAAPPDPTETTGSLAAEDGVEAALGDTSSLAPRDVGTDVPPLPGFGQGLRTLHTFIPRSIEIEQFPLVVHPYADANLVTGPDPIDGSASVRAPIGGTPLFVDWSDLGGALAHHRFLDASALVNGRVVDADTFGPGGEACLGARTIPAALDVSYVAVANNFTYAYLAALRAGAAVDADVAFVFTRARPESLAWTPCRDARTTLRFALTEGTEEGEADVLVTGHFVAAHGAPLFRVFVAGRPAEHLGPAAAIDTTKHWVEVPAIVAAAGNVTPTAAGSFGNPDPRAHDATTLAPGTFVELAVPMSLFAGTSAHRTRYLTVLTRERGDGRALVDVAGPMRLEMAAPKVTFPEPPLPQPWVPPEGPAWSEAMRE
jgi:hypothetical protein